MLCCTFFLFFIHSVSANKFLSIFSCADAFVFVFIFTLWHQCHHQIWFVYLTRASSCWCMWVELRCRHITHSAAISLNIVRIKFLRSIQMIINNNTTQLHVTVWHKTYVNNNSNGYNQCSTKCSWTRPTMAMNNNWVVSYVWCIMKWSRQSVWAIEGIEYFLVFYVCVCECPFDWGEFAANQTIRKFYGMHANEATTE